MFHEDDVPDLNLNKSKHPSPNWDLHKLHIEFKVRSSEDAFDDDDDDDDDEFEASPSTRQDTRGQIISYAALAFKYQHRCFLFTLLICGLQARILRWDRSGAIVTERFNYKENPEILVEFFERFSELTDAEQGMDDSVEVATDDERTMMETAASDDAKLEFRDYARVEFQNSLDPKRKWWKIAVHTGSSSSDQSDQEVAVRYFLVGKPHFYAGSMAGRGTRGYIALDLASLTDPNAKPHEKFVWLKDAWRVNQDGMEKEGDILNRLNERQVQNIPRLLCHGDVAGQHTRTQSFANHGSQIVFNRYTHYRMVVKDVGRSLKHFRNGKELISVIYDCVVGKYFMLLSR